MKTKEVKRIEAAIRQEAHNKLTVHEKMDKALSRPGQSEREVFRLAEKSF